MHPPSHQPTTEDMILAAVANPDFLIPDTPRDLASQSSAGSDAEELDDELIRDHNFNVSQTYIPNHNFSDSQFLDTQRPSSRLLYQQDFLSPRLTDSLIPSAQRSSDGHKIAIPYNGAPDAHSQVQGSIKDLSSLEGAFLSDSQLPDTQRTSIVLGNLSAATSVSDSQLPNTQRETDAQFQNSDAAPKPKVISSNGSIPDSQMPDTQREVDTSEDSPTNPFTIVSTQLLCQHESDCASTEVGVEPQNSSIDPRFSEDIMRLSPYQVEGSIAADPYHMSDHTVSTTSQETNNTHVSLSLLANSSCLTPTSSPLKGSEFPFPSANIVPDELKDCQLPTPAPTPRKEPVNKLSVRERKRIIVSPLRSPLLTTAMRLWYRNTNALLDPFREDDDCWLHPSPPRGHLSLAGMLRPHGKLQKTFMWQDHNGRHSLVLNFGIVTKLIYHDLTKQQQDGYINKQWHLSHLCGNWVCLNHKHTTVEPGNVNISRNNCFSHRSGCSHKPPCMKERKIALSADGKPIDHNASTAEAISEVRVGDWEDWSEQSMDGEESMVMGEDDDNIFFSRGLERELETQ